MYAWFIHSPIRNSEIYYVDYVKKNNSTCTKFTIEAVKEVFLKILQNSQENTCARVSFLIKLQA